MKIKHIILPGVLALGIIFSACTPETITVQSQPAPRTITVSGTGMVTLTPDIAYISIGVHTENASAKLAVSNNNSQAQAVITVFKPPISMYMRNNNMTILANRPEPRTWWIIPCM
jgi:uncharacterized protein YggE